MSKLVSFENAGPLLVRTDFWESHQAVEGFYFMSVNSGAFRLLLPRGCGVVGEIRSALEVVLTFGEVTRVWMEGVELGRQMVEVLFDDGSDTPFVIYLSIPEQVDRVPAAGDMDRWWEFTAWEDRRGVPHRVFSKRCFVRGGDLQCLEAAPKS